MRSPNLEEIWAALGRVMRRFDMHTPVRTKWSRLHILLLVVDSWVLIWMFFRRRKFDGWGSHEVDERIRPSKSEEFLFYQNHAGGSLWDHHAQAHHTYSPETNPSSKRLETTAGFSDPTMWSLSIRQAGDIFFTQAWQGLLYVSSCSSFNPSNLVNLSKLYVIMSESEDQGITCTLPCPLRPNSDV